MSFDPYYEWLGIPPEKQPPNYYRLLGIPDFDKSLRVIENAADQRILHLRTFQLGAHAAESERLLNEVSRARVCLLNSESKAIYDAQLEETLSSEQEPLPTLDQRYLEVRSPTYRTGQKNTQPLKLVLLGAAGLVAAMLVLYFGLTFGMFGARTQRQVDSKVAAVVRPKSTSKTSANEPTETVAPTTPEQFLTSVLNDLASSTVLRMTFDQETLTGPDGEKSVKDLSGHENDGVIHGATVVQGVKGMALSFQGRSYVDCGNASNLQPGDAFSISVWVYPIKGADYPRIVSKEGAYQLRWQSYRTDSGPLRFEGAFGTVRTARTPPYGKWHHIVVTFDRNSDEAELRMYHNGSLIALQKPKSSSGGNANGHLYLGVSGRNNKYEHYRGYLDELTILNRKITDDEVKAMYRAIAPADEPMPGAENKRTGM